MVTTQTQVKLRHYNLALGVSCLSGYTLKTLLGSGTYGVVHAACDLKGDCEYAVKVQVLPTKYERRAFKNEVYFTRLASQHGYGPKLYDGRICIGTCHGKACTLLGTSTIPSVARSGFASPRLRPPTKTYLGIIVMERYPKSYKSLKKQTQRPYMTLMRMLIMTHRAGVVHSDLLAKNIVVSQDKRNVKLIDWGLSFSFKDSPDSPYSFATWRKSFKNWFTSAMTSYLMPNFTVFYAVKAYDVVYAIIQWGFLVNFDYRPLLRAPANKTQTMHDYAESYLKTPTKVSHLLIIDWAFPYTEWLQHSGIRVMVRVRPETTGLSKSSLVPIYVTRYTTLKQVRKQLERWLRAFQQYKQPVENLMYNDTTLSDDITLASIHYTPSTFIREVKHIEDVGMDI